MKYRETKTSQSGFTIIEILLAFFIFGIVLTTVFASYSAVTSTTSVIYDSIAVYESAKNCLARMLLDLESLHAATYPAYSPPDIDDDPDPYRIIGDKSAVSDFSRLRFTSYANLPLEGDKRTGIAEIVYYVHTKDEKHTLRRSDSLFPDYRFHTTEFEEKGSDPILLENIKSLKFIFFDDEGVEYESWDSDSEEYEYATPRAVKIELEIGDETTSLFFETMVHFEVYRSKKN